MATAEGDSSAPDPRPRRHRFAYGRYLPTLVGVLVAVTAMAVYFLFFVKPPGPSGPAPVARLTSVEGNVRVKPSGGTDWGKGQPLQILKAGDVLQTDPRSGAEITFFTGNVARVRPDSVVLIAVGEAAVAQEATAWQIQSGQVSFQLKKETDIVTAGARMRAAANSTGNVNVTADGGTGVKIFQGSAQVSTRQGQTVNLVDNQAVLVDPHGKAGSTIELPPPPTLVTPLGKAELPYVAAPQVTTELQWQGVHGAATYHVSMDYNVRQAALLLSAALDQSGIKATAHALRGLDVGSYYWCVAGVSKEGLEGEYSKVLLFSVVRPTLAGPSLTVDTAVVLEGIVEVKGRTDPGASVTVDGYEVKVMPDGSFSEFVKTAEKEFVLVRATGAGGKSTEQKRTVAAN